MVAQWDRSGCENWDKVPVSALDLTKAMFGYTPSGHVTITEENYEDIAEYIFNHIAFYIFHNERGPEFSTERPSQTKVTLEQHKEILKNAIGFKRSYY